MKPSLSNWELHNFSTSDTVFRPSNGFHSCHSYNPLEVYNNHSIKIFENIQTQFQIQLSYEASLAYGEYIYFHFNADEDSKGSKFLTFTREIASD